MIDSICMCERNNIYNMVVLRSSIYVRKKTLRNYLYLILFRIFASVIACNYRIQVNSLVMDEN